MQPSWYGCRMSLELINKKWALKMFHTDMKHKEKHMFQTQNNKKREITKKYYGKKTN